ncbi:MAG: CYTH domain-containing protein [Cellvibrionaceae bacterium]
MAIEIERKFLVKHLPDHLPEGESIKQGYLHSDKALTVRVRTKGEKAFLTIKGATEGISRAEYEYEIPVAEAESMLSSLCRGPKIEKTRYTFQENGHLWELDVFSGDNEGLTVAEVELQSEQETVRPPAWIGEEVSNDPRYFNSNLARKPFKSW